MTQANAGLVKFTNYSWDRVGMSRPFKISFADDELLPDCCRAAVLFSPGGKLEIAFMELAENHGRSVTNSWSLLAERFLASHLPNVAKADVSWFEVYPYYISGLQNVSRVLIKASGHRFEYEQDPIIRMRIWRALEIQDEDTKPWLDTRSRRPASANL
jgi:hypothetical protein